KHDPGKPPDRNPPARGQGTDSRRDDEPHPRTCPPRLRGRDLGPSWAGGPRRARGCLPRHPRVCFREFRRRRGKAEGASGPPLKPPPRRIRPDRADIERAAKLIAKAKRPLLLTGGGIHLSEAWDALIRFAEAQSIPVAHTMTGKGGIACVNALSVGLFGRYSRIANDLIEASDCLIVVGCKLGEIATKRFALPPRHIPVIHLDIVAEEIGRCIPAEIALWGDARAGLEDFADALSDGAA